MNPPAARMDHLVIAATSLGEAADYLGGMLGVDFAPGGKHAAMGTHNRLLRLGPALYLEVIALDPDAPSPRRPRWFGLDAPALQARIRQRPRLIHWVARSDDIAASRAACPEPLGEILSMSRGDLQWLITVPGDGHLPGDGLVPSLIRWETRAHPAARLPESGCALMKLEGFHSEPARIGAALRALGVEEMLALHPCEAGEAPGLVAYVKTPGGLREID